MVVANWSSTYRLYDKYIFSDDLRTSGWISAGFGFTIMVAATVFQNQILVFVTSRQNYRVRFLLQRMYGYVMAHACISQYRGVWELQDDFIGVYFSNALWTYIIANVALISLRCLVMTYKPPIRIAMDFPSECFYEMHTFFSIKPDRAIHLRLLDAMFTYCLVSALEVCVWRGLWEMLDDKLYPGEHKHRSAVCSLIIGYGLLIVMGVIQPVTIRVCIYLEGVHYLLKLIFEDIISLVTTFVCLNLWRGYWELLWHHLPYQPGSLWVVHGLTYIITALGLVSNSIIARGCERDGEEEEGGGVTLESSYVTLVSSYLMNGSQNMDNTESTPEKSHD